VFLTIPTQPILSIHIHIRGGGHKRLYRQIDFRRNEKNIYGRIVTIEYDPNRNASICLIHYGDGEKKYILHPRGAIIGDTIVSGTEVPIKMGNGQLLYFKIPMPTEILLKASQHPVILLPSHF